MTTATMNGKKRTVTAVGPDVTNGAEQDIDLTRPYRVQVTVKGVADMLFHRWNCEAVAEKSAAAKGSKAKKTDNIESYVYRDERGMICVPGEYLRQAVIGASKYRQDPRSPRKSAQDLTKAALVTLTTLASIGTKQWDYEHKCRVQVQRNGVTRVRPAMKAGWEAEFVFMVNLPEYVNPDMLLGLLNDAGRLIGLGDFRPTYGRFAVTNFKVLGE